MTDIVINVINFFKKLVVFLLPESLFISDLFINLDKYLSIFVDWIVQINFLIPLPTIFLIFIYMASFRSIYFGIFVFNWILRRIVDAVP